MSIVEFLFSEVFVGGVIMACAAVLLLALARREGRVRPDAWWSGERFVYIVVAPLVTILGAAGGGLAMIGIDGWAAQPVSAQGLALASAASLTAGLGYWLLSREPAVEPPAMRARLEPRAAVAVS